MRQLLVALSLAGAREVRGAFDSLHAATDMASFDPDASDGAAPLAHATLSAASLHLELGHVLEAEACAGEALRLGQYMGDAPGASAAMLLVAATAVLQRDGTTACEMLARVRTRSRVAGLWRLHAMACVALAELERSVRAAYCGVWSRTSPAGAVQTDGVRIIPRWMSLDCGVMSDGMSVGIGGVGVASGAGAVPIRERQVYAARMHGVRASALASCGAPALSQIAGSVAVRCVWCCEIL